ncbi:MAG TPA: aminodeoxychorismate synthase component I [Terracidiphilus sp.]|nr:aminodeoxychorismate synthase component I [Terracidiphilus sp.]
MRTARPDAENRKSFLFTEPLHILSTDHPNEIPTIFASIDSALRDGHYVAGFLSYEAGYHFEPAARRNLGPLRQCDLPLAWFGVYREPLTCDGSDRSWAASGDHIIVEPGTFSIDISSAEYSERVQTIRRYIEAGDLYQANLTMLLRQPWNGDAAGLFERIMENQPVPYGCLINTGQAHILSASPELFFRKQGSKLLVRPMKGTSPRGRDFQEDCRKAAWLAADEKNRAENVMIVDLLRNDLGRICTAGSIEVSDLFAVERHPDLLQMTSTVRGLLNPGTSSYEIFRSLFPCGSITGAPKIRTMQIIRQLEDQPRGIACGAIGYFSPGGDATFSVAIRTLVVSGGEIQMRVGSGVTYDSNPEAEYAECLLKAKFVTRNLPRFELIETILWENDFFLLDLHLERLKASADYFEFQCDLEDVRAQLDRLAASFQPNSRRRVRMLLSRSGQLSITDTPLAPAGISASIVISTRRTDSSDAFLRHKTTYRATYDRAFADARAAGFDDVLFLNEREEVTECAIHNVMIEKNGRLVTPSLECGLLPGVYRRHLLATHPELEQAVITLEQVLSADRVFIFNSVQGMLPVRKIVTNNDLVRGSTRLRP